MSQGQAVVVNRFGVAFVATLLVLVWVSAGGCASVGGAPEPPAGDDDELPSCNCYYAVDCKKWFGDKTICDRNYGNGGPGGKETECRFMKPKPDRRANKKGCETSTEGKPSTCDGHCVKPDKGSSCAAEDRGRVAQAVDLWSEGFIASARTGGGLVAPDPVAESRTLGLSEECEGQVARIVLSLMVLSWSDILIHPDVPHVEQDHRVPDLSDDTCRLQVAEASRRALVTAVAEPGSEVSLGGAFREACGDELPLADPCLGEDAVECAEDLIRDMATYLSTPVGDAMDTALWDSPPAMSRPAASAAEAAAPGRVP